MNAIRTNSVNWVTKNSTGKENENIVFPLLCSRPFKSLSNKQKQLTFDGQLLELIGYRFTNY